MADRHPYVSSLGGLVQVINHFRRSFPDTVNAGTLKRLGYAPNNESYVLEACHLEMIVHQNQQIAFPPPKNL